MPEPTKRELERENQILRSALEEVLDRIGEVLDDDDADQGED